MVDSRLRGEGRFMLHSDNRLQAEDSYAYHTDRDQSLAIRSMFQTSLPPDVCLAPIPLAFEKMGFLGGSQ